MAVSKGVIHYLDYAAEVPDGPVAEHAGSQQAHPRFEPICPPAKLVAPHYRVPAQISNSLGIQHTAGFDGSSLPRHLLLPFRSVGGLHPCQPRINEPQANSTSVWSTFGRSNVDRLMRLSTSAATILLQQFAQFVEQPRIFIGGGRLPLQRLVALADEPRDLCFLARRGGSATAHGLWRIAALQRYRLTASRFGRFATCWSAVS